MKLFTPINIGKLEVKNRIVMPPMGTGFASEDGHVTERVIHYYEERAKGGAGLIIVEGAAVERRGRFFSLQHLIHHDRYIPGLQRLAEAIKRHGAVAALQILHGGARASAKFTQIQPVCPSSIPDYPAGKGPGPRALTVKEIRDVISAFGEAARRAREAGFDAIELHGTHSYLIDEFMSPIFNRRADPYGGTFQNRVKLACEVIDCVRGKVGRDFPIIFRMTGDDFVEGGLSLEDAKRNAGFLVRSGADCLHVSIGGASSRMVPTLPMGLPDGYFLHLAEGIKKEVEVPVIGMGKIRSPEFAEKALEEGKADLLAMGRALIADPYLPKKAAEGRKEDIVPCIYCNQGCITRLANELEIRCTVNPAVGREGEFEILPAKKSRKVLIAGAGPAGLEAALAAKQRGHDVILADRREQLGGQLNYASKPPGKEVIGEWMDYFSREVKKWGIKTYLGREVTKEFVREIHPDVLVVATGSTPAIPEIPGIKGGNVSPAVEVLDGKKRISGERVIVVGGGQVGLETADFLAEAGKKVTVLEMLADVGTDIPPRNKMFLMKKLSEENVLILVNRKVKEIFNEGVRADHLGQEEEFKGDAVVIGMGSKPERTLLEELGEVIPELDGFYAVGDCIEPRKALEAACEGARVGREI